MKRLEEDRGMGGVIGDATRRLGAVAVLLLATACAGGPGPGDPGYTYNVDGRYVGRLMVERERFDATFDLSTGPDGRVRGDFAVRAPLEIAGDVSGTVVDDLLRITLSYESADRDGGVSCEGRIEGILTVGPGGGTVEGPVTITDCGDGLSGRLSFRRSSGG